MSVTQCKVYSSDFLLEEKRYKVTSQVRRDSSNCLNIPKSVADRVRK